MKKSRQTLNHRHYKEIPSWCKAAVMDGVFLTPLWGELGEILGVTLCLGVYLENDLRCDHTVW